MTLGALRFHWLDWGAAGKRPMLLLHGAAQTAHSWDEVAPDLANDHHVVALDQRGHGDSDWSPDHRYRRDDMVADVVALLDHLGWETATFLALSMGGLNALTLAVTHPERIDGLVVVDVAPKVESRGTEAIRKQLSVFEFDSLEEAVARAHAFNPRRTLENIRERMRHGLRQRDDGKWVYKFDPGIATFEASGGDLESLWERLPAIRCPVLLVRGGESDVLARETAERFHAVVSGSESAEVPGAGHSVMGDNPSGFLAAVRPFLARHGL